MAVPVSAYREKEEGIVMTEITVEIRAVDGIPEVRGRIDTGISLGGPNFYTRLPDDLARYALSRMGGLMFCVERDS